MTEQASSNAVNLTSKDYAVIAARAADSKKATDIIVQFVGEIISVTDYFVIVTAANSRQVGAIIDAIYFSADVAELGLTPGCRVDVAFYHYGGIRFDEMPSEDISTGMIFGVEPFFDNGENVFGIDRNAS